MNQQNKNVIVKGFEEKQNGDFSTKAVAAYHGYDANMINDNNCQSSTTNDMNEKRNFFYVMLSFHNRLLYTIMNCCQFFLCLNENNVSQKCKKNDVECFFL